MMYECLVTPWAIGYENNLLKGNSPFSSSHYIHNIPLYTHFAAWCRPGWFWFIVSPCIFQWTLVRLDWLGPPFISSPQ